MIDFLDSLSGRIRGNETEYNILSDVENFTLKDANINSQVLRNGIVHLKRGSYQEGIQQTIELIEQRSGRVEYLDRNEIQKNEVGNAARFVRRGERSDPGAPPGHHRLIQIERGLEPDQELFEILHEYLYSLRNWLTTLPPDTRDEKLLGLARLFTDINCAKADIALAVAAGNPETLYNAKWKYSKLQNDPTALKR
jgi:hypothetical protein